MAAPSMRRIVGLSVLAVAIPCFGCFGKEEGETEPVVPDGAAPAEAPRDPVAASPSSPYDTAPPGNVEPDLKTSSELRTRQAELVAGLEKNPGDAQARSELADVQASLSRELLLLKDYKGALGVLYNSLTYDSDRPDRWERLGDLCSFSGHRHSRDMVQFAYEQAVVRDPSRQKACIKLASSYVAGGRYLDAVELFEALIRNTDTVLSFDHLGAMVSAYMLEDELERGQTFFKRMYEESGDNAFTLSLALLIAAGGDADQAVELLNRIEEQEEADSPLRAYAGQLKEQYRAGGRNERTGDHP